MRKIISLICLLLPALAGAAQPRADAPNQYTVVKGDTLWDIAARFFNDPWQWPEIWQLNRDSIRDPHWIYPGDLIFLDHASGRLQVQRTTGEARVIRLSPRIHTRASENQAIPVIPLADIRPFLTRPLLIGPETLDQAPMLIGTLERRVVLGDGDTAFVERLNGQPGDHWLVYRPGGALIDPDTGALLGYETQYLGEAQTENPGNPSAIRITHAVQEIKKGDRLIAPVATPASDNFVPHTPAAGFNAKIISIHNHAALAGQHAVVTLNKGANDGLEAGHVLALERHGEVVGTSDRDLCEAGDVACRRGDQIALPNQRYGLLMVFRTFERVSYALVLETRLPVEPLDTARTP